MTQAQREFYDLCRWGANGLTTTVDLRQAWKQLRMAGLKPGRFAAYESTCRARMDQEQFEREFGRPFKVRLANSEELANRLYFAALARKYGFKRWEGRRVAIAWADVDAAFRRLQGNARGVRKYYHKSYPSTRPSRVEVEECGRYAGKFSRYRRYKRRMRVQKFVVWHNRRLAIRCDGRDWLVHLPVGMRWAWPKDSDAGVPLLVADNGQRLKINVFEAKEYSWEWIQMTLVNNMMHKFLK